MRRASFEINGKYVSGHWSLEKYNVGDFYKSRVNEKLFVVEKVFEGEFKTQDGWGQFYQIREATDIEVAEYNKPTNPEEEKRVFESFFDALDN